MNINQDFKSFLERQNADLERANVSHKPNTGYRHICTVSYATKPRQTGVDIEKLRAALRENGVSDFSVFSTSIAKDQVGAPRHVLREINVLWNDVAITQQTVEETVKKELGINNKNNWLSSTTEQFSEMFGFPNR